MLLININANVTDKTLPDQNKFNLKVQNQIVPLYLNASADSAQVDKK